MPSPFPGMNPYLERDSMWPTFRLQFIVGCMESLVLQIRPNYVLRIDRRKMPGPEAERVPYLKALDASNQDTIVTHVELLGPGHKYPGPGRDHYLGWRREVLQSPTHLVEIDLTRGGLRVPMCESIEFDYCAVVSRAGERPQAGLWPWRLRDRLPVIPIPLRPSDGDAVLDLKAVIDHQYDAGGYEHMAYCNLPEPPLRPDDAAWASQFVPPAMPR